MVWLPLYSHNSKPKFSIATLESFNPFVLIEANLLNALVTVKVTGAVDCVLQ